MQAGEIRRELLKQGIDISVGYISNILRKLEKWYITRPYKNPANGRLLWTIRESSKAVEIIAEELRVSGVGIQFGTVPKSVNTVIYRRYTKYGKVFSFDREPVGRLAVLRDHALLLVSNAYLLDREEPLDIEGFKRIGVLGYELDRLGTRYRYRRFKPWRLYRGRVCVGRVCEEVGWMIWVPTYHRRYILVLCDPETMSNVDNLVWAYISGEKRRRRA